MRVIPVQEDAGWIHPGRVCDPLDEPRDLRFTEPDDVDATDDDPSTAGLEGESGRLERQVSVADRRQALPDEPHHRDAQRRLE